MHSLGYWRITRGIKFNAKISKLHLFNGPTVSHFNALFLINFLQNVLLQSKVNRNGKSVGLCGFISDKRQSCLSTGKQIQDLFEFIHRRHILRWNGADYWHSIE